MNLALQYSERIYKALLSLYPVRFRVRFAPEMAQLFRDRCRDALKARRVGPFITFLLQATRDLCVSVLRERGRELMDPADPGHPLSRVIDLMLIPSIVTANLLVLGPILTLLVLGGARIPPEEFARTSGFFSFAIGSLAVLASLVINRLRPTVRLWVKLSA